MNITEKENQIKFIQEKIKEDKKIAEYIEKICLYRKAFLEKRYEESDNYAEEVQETENKFSKENEAMLVNIREILIKMDLKEIEYSLNSLKDK